AALLALAATLARPWTAGGRPDGRLLLLGEGALAGAALASAGPGLGVIDVRFVPLAQLSLALAGAAGLGLALSRLARADLAAAGLLLLAVAHAEGSSRILRQWIDWNYSGLEAKELWPAWKALNERIRGGPGDPRVAFEYSPVHERAGSIRMHETVPFFSGRSGIEGVYNQASVTTHPVYYLLSELYPSPPNPFRSRTYSRFDLETGLSRLRLLNVGHLVAVTPVLVSALDAREEVVREASIAPYTLYRVVSPGPGYVEPLAFAPVRAPREGWRDASFHWFSRKPANRAVLVFTDDPRFDLVAADPWAPPPERPLEGGVEVRETVEAAEIRIATSRPGHPLLVKVSYHPRWRAEGADGPFLASPGFMLVVPREREVRLRYAARAWPDAAGILLAAAGVVAAWALRRRSVGANGEGAVAAPRPLAAATPLVLVLAIAALRLVPGPDHAPEAEVLDRQASRAFAGERWADAAEHARRAVSLLPDGDDRRAGLLCLQGEALLRAGHAREAVEPLALVAEGTGPLRPQALFSGAAAREQAGDRAGAAAWREALRRDHAG
ncbi:MAG TPA: 6-pyruvoyl-tetrahydropterin synthase-related protein, partial [Vicinamibacteria bacterium]